MDSSQTSTRRQRPRPIRSCLQCRRMKAKCDRLLPCGRCVRIGASRECSYNDTRHPRHYSRISETLPNGSDAEHISPIHEVRSLIQSGLPADAANAADTAITATTANTSNSFSNCERSTVKESPATSLGLHSRVERLERALKDRLDKELLDGEHSAASSSLAIRLHPMKTSGVLDFKGSRSRYYSRTHWITLFRQFDEAGAIMQNIIKDPVVPPLLREVQTLQKRAFAKRRRLASLEPCIEPARANAKLLDILPTQNVCERLIDIYFKTWESTFRILHRPSFLDTLRVFWGLSLEAKIGLHGFVPQLVAVLAVACSNTSNLLNDSLSDSAWSDMACNALDLWLFGLLRKDRNEISTLQTNCLFILAMQLNMYPPDKLWNATGSLVRSAMTMGLHIDPESLDLSVLQQETRRRLWVTVVEFDLQASQAAGMAPSLQADMFNSDTPANLTDSHLNTVHTPPQLENPVDIFTDISLQHILAGSLRLRLEIASLLSRAQLQKQDIQNLLRKRELLEEAIHNVPPTLRSEQSTNGSESPRRLFAYVLVYMSLVRTLFSVDLFLASDLSKKRDEELKKSSLQCALLVLSTLDEVSSSGLNSDFENPQKFVDIFLVLFWTDVYAAVLVLNTEIRRLNLEGSSTTIRSHDSSASKRKFLAWPKTTVVRTAEIAIETLLRKPNHPAADLKNVSRLFVALQSVVTSGCLEEKVRNSKEGILKILNDYKRFFINSGFNVAESNFESTYQSHTGISIEEQSMEGFDSNFDPSLFEFNFDSSTLDFFSFDS